VREPLEWHYHASDLRQLQGHPPPVRDTAAQDLSAGDIFTYKLYYRFVKGVRVVKPLNYVPYIKEDAMQTASNASAGSATPHKHYESRFTRFYEGLLAADQVRLRQAPRPLSRA
jgi:hypothetical protein